MENDNPLGLSGPEELYRMALELDDTMTAAEDADKADAGDTMADAGEMPADGTGNKPEPTAATATGPTAGEDTPCTPTYQPMKALPSDQQPREKALKYGCSALSNHELLALILRTGVRGYRITDMTADLLRQNGNSLLSLARRELNELKLTKGLGPTKALQLLAMMEIGRRMAIESVGDRPIIRCSADIFRLMKPMIGNLDHEEIHIIFLNRRLQVTGTRCLTSGSSGATIFDVKMILRLALSERAHGIIMCHNHPSGNPVPSGQDDQITKALVKGCEAIDLKMLDHLIITNDTHYSYADTGRL